jgi:diguanylate cyclase (GGDEF)-like protein
MMPFKMPISVPIMLGEIVGAAALTLLLALFARRFRKEYLRHWIWSWVMLTLVYGGHFVASLPLGSDVKAGLAPLVNSAAWLQILFLLFGVWELTRHLSVRMRMQRSLVPAVAVAGGLFGVVLSPMSSAILVGFLSAGAAICASIWTLLYRGKRSAPGLMLFGGALFGKAVSDLVTAILLAAARPFTTADVALIQFAIHAVIGVAMVVALLDDEREAAVMAASEIEHLAYNDPLTGLPNRSLFFDRVIISLAQATRQQHSLSVLFLDIDRFKEINDSLGHSLGDALLRAAAKRIRDCLRQGDTLARFGGDEFTILLPRVEKVEDASAVATKILAAIRQPFHLAGRELVVTTSIGLSVFPSDGLDAETLVKNADTAMYRAKESGRDNYQLYTAELNSRAIEKLDLENRLRRAVDSDELVIHYQPIVNVEKNTIHGFEALLRWRHPHLGLLSPGQFIDAAELSGLTVPIGEWVLKTACRQAREWQIQFGVELAVSVNLSARQLQEPELITQVREALRDSGLPPRLLDLEITESSAMRNLESSADILRNLRALGIRIALDDFGTGYSSLTYLQRFPVDILKLDRSFLREVEKSTDTAITTAVVEMAKALGMKVVAEGVETEEQYSFIFARGCELAQGFFFSEAMPAEECTRYISENTVPRLATGRIDLQRLALVKTPGRETPPARTGSEEVIAPRRGTPLHRSEIRKIYESRHDLISDN